MLSMIFDDLDVCIALEHRRIKFRYEAISVYDLLAERQNFFWVDFTSGCIYKHGASLYSSWCESRNSGPGPSSSSSDLSTCIRSCVDWLAG